ncbi:MAG: dual specificity protein phosphatase family protein, partial [Planctomycetaceae bacterium]
MSNGTRARSPPCSITFATRWARIILILTHMARAVNMFEALFESNALDEVVPGRLYIGSEDARAHVHLAEHGITHVVCLQTQRERNVYPERLKTLPPHVQERVLDFFEDSPGTLLTSYVPLVMEAIDAALAEGPDKRVLVHCAAGISRSAAMVIAWLMWTIPGLTAEQAYNQLKAKRRCIGPNAGFCKQLREDVPLLLYEMRMEAAEAPTTMHAIHVAQ